MKTPVQFTGTLTSQPIFISDSKGVYLKNHASTICQSVCYIDFECKKGARFADYFCWLQKNLHRKVNQFGYVTLYIFLGTCDLTKLVYVSEKSGNRTRQKRYIGLRHSTDYAAVNYITGQIDKICCLVSYFPTVSVVFLEIPPYSIREWNRYQGHPKPDNFESQNRILYERISLVNDYIREINSALLHESPRFSKDLKRGRKEKGQHRRYSLCFKEYKDGIHSRSLLSRVWMKRILLRIIKECV